jgi:hypothetical protein
MNARMLFGEVVLATEEAFEAEVEDPISFTGPCL